MEISMASKISKVSREVQCSSKESKGFKGRIQRWQLVDSDGTKVETPIHDNIRELVTWERKEHGVKSWMC
jgi:hypothetical protein